MRAEYTATKSAAPALLSLILRRRVSAVSKDEARAQTAAWMAAPEA